MKDAQQPGQIILNSVIERLREGRYVIPNFQRDFEWKPSDISELMRSIFLDYYIGSLLLWKGKDENFDALGCEPVYGYEQSDANAEHIVLDGQQRLTAMYYAFIGPDVSAPNRKSRFLYFIRVDQLMAGVSDEAIEYDWTQRGVRLLDKPKEQYESHKFPLTILGKGGWELGDWVRGYEQYWTAKRDSQQKGGESGLEAAQHAKNAREFGQLIKDITEKYQISYIELDRELPVEKVCDIFTQINSRGIQLDVFDLLNAMLVPKGLQLKYLWREAEERLAFVDSNRLNVYVLQVMSIIKQNYCSPKYLYYLLPGQPRKIRDPDGTRRTEIIISDGEEFKDCWNSAVDALENSINQLRHPQKFGASSSKYLPYISILPVFASLQAHAKTLPPEKRLDANRKIRHWYWASVFTKRYSGSVASTSARDFLDIKKWIENSEIEPNLILEFKNRFRNLELRRETKSGSSVYNGIFNLLVLNGAQDWMSGEIPDADALDDHHIVPAKWANKHLKRDLGNTILNRTPLTEDTNRKVIRDSLPNEYLPELIRTNGEKTVRAILESHFISPVAQEILLRDPFTPDDYDEFISERQRTIQRAIESLLIKERLDLEPQLRELDARIENIELTLRKTIVEALHGDVALLPSHLEAKLKEGVQRALKKNAALDHQHLDTLPGMLEYADFRHLQATITNKALWEHFSERFASKQTVINKFDQLAELRNAIRHSRAVDEITRKEGEAAILWFEKVLIVKKDTPSHVVEV